MATTKKGKLTMNDMLSGALHEYHGLREQLDRNLLGRKAKKWTEELKRFLREEPYWAEEMMFKPIEWGAITGPIQSDKEAVSFVEITNRNLPKESHWRIPTIGELKRGLEARVCGFGEGVNFYSCTPEIRGLNFGNEVMRMNCGHLCGSDFYSLQSMRERCFLRLCRAKKLD